MLDWARNAGRRYDLVYASSPPYSTAVLGAELKEVFGCPLIVDIKDNWITARGRYDEPRRQREARLERQVIEAADAVICVTPAALETYREVYEQVFGT